jgi:hypothetical protein
MAGRHAPEYPNKIKRKKRKEKRASNDGPHLKLRNKMAAAFVSSIVIHILNEGKGKTRGDHQADVVVRDRYVIYIVGRQYNIIHTQKEIESKDPIPCGIEKIKRRWEKKKKKRLLANDMRRGPAKKNKKQKHFDRQQHRGKAEREKGQSQNGSNVYGARLGTAVSLRAKPMAQRSQVARGKWWEGVWFSGWREDVRGSRFRRGGQVGQPSVRIWVRAKKANNVTRSRS